MTTKLPRSPRRRASSAVTMETVARHAGLSPMSVSKVINGRTVRPETREAVLRAIEELNYTPNAAARQLASAETFLVGLLYHDPRQTFFSDLLVGALNAATRLGAQVALQHVDLAAPDGAWTGVQALRDRGAKGVLLPPVFCEHLERHPRLAEFTIPLIGLAPGEDLQNISCVRVDDFAAARDMTSLLIQKGCRRIGFIRAPAHLSIHGSRFGGYLEALQAHGLPFDPELIVESALTFEAAHDATGLLLDLKRPPTAIFASNDEAGVGALMAAQMRGLSVPRDLIVAGFDDSSLATKVFPPLTTVRQPISAMAGAAVERLVRHGRGGIREPSRGVTYFDYAVIRRRSTND